MGNLSLNYLDRLTDVNILGTDADPGLRTTEVGFGSGSVIGGPYKETQKFLRVLLSDKGSLAGQADYGTDFFKKLDNGVILNEAQFRAYFAAAKATALSFMHKAKRVKGIPDPRFKDDEIIVDVVILSLIVEPGTVKAVLKFTFNDRDLDIVLPVGIPVGV